MNERDLITGAINMLESELLQNDSDYERDYVEKKNDFEFPSCKYVIEKLKAFMRGDILYKPDKYVMPLKEIATILERTLLEFNNEQNDTTKQVRAIHAGLYVAHTDFLTMNGILPKSFGEEIEKLFYDDSILLGVHGTLVKHEIIESETFNAGLLNNYGPAINRTVHMKDSDTDLSHVMRYVYRATGQEENVVLVTIPKTDVESGVPLWREEYDKEKAENKYFLNPKYIYGYYNVIDKGNFNNEATVHRNNKSYTVSGENDVLNGCRVQDENLGVEALSR